MDLLEHNKQYKKKHTLSNMAQDLYDTTKIDIIEFCTIIEKLRFDHDPGYAKLIDLLGISIK